jgi:hypothetical protein
VRQGKVTLSHSKVAELYPGLAVRSVYTNQAKQRWSYILGATEKERATRELFIRHKKQAYQPLIPPRLLTKVFGSGGVAYLLFRWWERACAERGHALYEGD